jgi:hypothetical protein
VQGRYPVLAKMTIPFWINVPEVGLESAPPAKGTTGGPPPVTGPCLTGNSAWESSERPGIQYQGSIFFPLLPADTCTMSANGAVPGAACCSIAGTEVAFGPMCVAYRVICPESSSYFVTVYVVVTAVEASSLTSTQYCARSSDPARWSPHILTLASPTGLLLLTCWGDRAVKAGLASCLLFLEQWPVRH